MQDMWVETARGQDHVNLLIGGQTAYTAYWDSLQEIQRITNAESGAAGFNSLSYLDAPVIFDGDSGLNTNRLYFLNTDFLFWQPHSKPLAVYKSSLIDLESRTRETGRKFKYSVND